MISRVRSPLLVWPWNLIGLIVVAPLLALVVQTFAVRWFYPDILPNEWLPSAPFEVLRRTEVRSAVWTSTKIAFLTTLIALLVGLPAAWYLVTKSVRGRPAIFGLLLMPQLLPPLTAGVGLNIAFLKVGLSDGTVPVVLAHLVPVLPYVVGISAVTFSRLDVGYLEVASGLGLSSVQRFRRVVLPLTWVGVERAAFVGFIVSWSQYLLTLLVGGGRVVTLPMLVLSSGSGSNVSLFAGLALITAVVPVGLFLFVQKDTLGN